MKEEWQSIFQMYLDERNRQYTAESIAEGISRVTLNRDLNEMQRWERIDYTLKERQAVIHHAHSHVHILGEREEEGNLHIPYLVTMTWHIRQQNEEIIQKTTEARECVMRFENGWWIIGDEVSRHENKPEREQRIKDEDIGETPSDPLQDREEVEQLREHPLQRVAYDRQKAVAYAERWWNDYNPRFKKFEDDCTNYISQCMWAGNAPMVHTGDRSKGWWYRFDAPVNWSFSWTVAHALRWFLPNRATEVNSPEQLEPGDIICYDFTGDGRWQHNTIVVAKDAYGRPLVNAHTTNSQHRYWDYRDSYAWTDNTKYKFFKLHDQF